MTAREATSQRHVGVAPEGYGAGRGPRAALVFAILCVALFFNGITLIAVGILGSYTGRAYEEAKDRPLYVIRDKVNFD